MSDVTEVFAKWDERDRQAVELYAALRSNERTRKRALTIVYRCPVDRCTLAEFYASPAGLLAHQPPYKLSPALNLEESSDSGRAANTRDGDRHWKEQTGFMDSAEWNRVLNCDHIHAYILEGTRVQEDVKSGRREVIITP